MAGAVDLACVMHVHSTCSDGSGTVPEIAAAAAGGLIGGAALVVWATYGWGTVRRVGARRLRQGSGAEPGAQARAQARREAQAR